MSQDMAIALSGAPAAVTAAASGSRRRPTKTTVQPWATSVEAVAFPTPVPAPVTSAILLSDMTAPPCEALQMPDAGRIGKACRMHSAGAQKKGGQCDRPD